MRKRLFLLILILSTLLATVIPVQASELSISHLEIDIWPEYDQPSVLVIFHVSFSSTSSLPARVSLRIPASAGDPYSVAMKDLDGMMYDLEYSVIPDGNWNRIEFVTSSQDLQLEFYKPYFNKSKVSRGFFFSWISDYPIQDLSVSIQHPKTAVDMVIQPNPDRVIVNPNDGLTYYKIDYGSLEKGASLTVSLAYVKTNDELSASIGPVEPASPLPAQRTIWQSIESVLPSIWGNRNLMITAALLLCALFLFALLLLVVRGPVLTRPTRHKAERGNSKAKVASKEEKEIYCFQCGKKARPGDVFCRTCGSKLIE
jgi:hypothetical protein